MSQRYILTVGNNALLAVDATSGNEPVPLPFGYASGRSFTVRRLDASASSVTVSATGGETLNGVTNGSISIPGREQVEFVGGDGAWITVGYGGAESAAATAAPGTDEWLKLHAGGNLDALIVGTVTRDVNDAATSADVEWPDGTAGVYTGTPSVGTLGAIDSYTVTYVGPVTKTVTQPTVTRNASGAVTARPEMTVS